MKAVIYARFSSSSQREESIEGQVRECRKYAQKLGYEVIRTYEDRAMTGRTDKRPAFQKMIADSAKKQFDAVICWKTDRFARNRYDSALYKRKLKLNGVKVLYAMESIPDGAQGIIMESVMEGFAEYYSANLSENVKRGNLDSALQHKTLGVRVLGLKTASDGTYEIDEETAPVVRRIFSEYDSGKPMADICRDLNADGIRTSMGNLFNKSSLGRILHNEKYIGVYHFADIREEGIIPAIISRDQFDRVQSRMKHKAHAPKAKAVRFLLTGKLFCGHCGSAMTGESARSKNKETYYYYTCVQRKAHACTKKRVRKDSIEKLIIEELYRRVHDDEYINEIADLCMEQQSDHSELDDLERRKKETDRKLSNMRKAIEAGIITKTTKEAILELEDQAWQIDQAIAEMRLKQPNLSREEVLELLYALRDGEIEDERYTDALIDTFLNSVYLYDDGTCVIHMQFTQQDAVTLEYTESVRQATASVCQSERERTQFGIITEIRKGAIA